MLNNTSTLFALLLWDGSDKQLATLDSIEKRVKKLVGDKY